MIKIYMLVFKNGQKYIGQTKNDPDLRPTQYIHSTRHGNRPVTTALQADPNPQIIILHECLAETANELEQAAIQEYNTLIPNGLNVSKGGNVNRTKLTNEARIHMRAEKIQAKLLAKQERKKQRAIAKQVYPQKLKREHLVQATNEALTRKYPKLVT